MAVKRKCSSRTFPCPSGDRCPEHRGQAEAVINALKSSDIEAASLLTKDKLEAEEKKKLKAFLESMTVKTKRDGSSIVTVKDDKTVFESFNGKRTLKVTKTSRKKIEVPAVDPVEAVDKTIAVRSGSDYKNGFQNNLNAIYDNNVVVSDTNTFGSFVLNKIDMPDSYRGKGVESHVLASYVVDHRPDLYDFYGNDLSIPYSEYEKAGFEPNPYYWAGKTHPETGITYPTEQELDASWDDETVDREKYSYYQLYTLRSLGHPEAKQYPYTRQKHGWTFKDIPLTEDFNKEKYKEVSRKWSDKSERELKSKGWGGPLDIH
jgi:hypothetical protein